MAKIRLEYLRGPWGEIFPPPLLGGMAVEDVVQELQDDTADTEQPLDRVPTRGASRAGLENLAAINVQGKLVRQALDGELDSPEAKGLRFLVVEKREPLSLRPLFSEGVVHFSFAPVLTLRGDNRWQIGLPDYGKHCEVIEAATPSAAYDQALALYVQWEDDAEERLIESARSYPRTLTADYYARLLEALTPGEPMPFPNGWHVGRGKHDTWSVILGSRGMRFILASPAVVAKVVLMLANALKEPIPLPHATDIMAIAMVDTRLPLPRPVGDQGEPEWEAEVWGFKWLSRDMPAAGRWGEISWKGNVFAALEVIGRGESVQLVGLQKPIVGKVLTKWAAREFQTLAAAEDLSSVAPLFWATREVARNVKQRQGK